LFRWVVGATGAAITLCVFWVCGLVCVCVFYEIRWVFSGCLGDPYGCPRQGANLTSGRTEKTSSATLEDPCRRQWKEKEGKEEEWKEEQKRCGTGCAGPLLADADGRRGGGASRVALCERLWRRTEALVSGS
jgi:hypothetical protein